jgi:hypothetical protein
MAKKGRKYITYYFRNGYTLNLYLLILVSFVLFSCENEKTYNLNELHQKYMAASINHDLETLEKMTHDSIIWILGPYTFKGKEAALGPNRYDKGTDAKFEYKNVTIRQDTVEFEFFERNGILTAMSMEGVKHYPRFIFKNGLLIKKEAWKPSPDIQTMNQRSQPRRNWIKINHPEIFQKFFDSTGNFVWSEENGKLQIQMAREWKKAKQSEKIDSLE